MPKQLLSGSLDEQCEFLYSLALKKMGEGNYTGAAHALQEIVKYAPNYRDAPQLLAEVKRRKAEQRTLVLTALLGMSLFIGIGSLLRLPNDLLLLLLALGGAIVGYGAGNVLVSLRRRPPAST